MKKNRKRAETEFSVGFFFDSFPFGWISFRPVSIALQSAAFTANQNYMFIRRKNIVDLNQCSQTCFTEFLIIMNMIMKVFVMVSVLNNYRFKVVKGTVYFSSCELLSKVSAFQTPL